jgi:hypothetical protein
MVERCKHGNPKYLICEDCVAEEPEGAVVLREIVEGLEGVTPGPWVENGQIVYYPDSFNAREINYVARCSPASIRKISEMVAADKARIAELEVLLAEANLVGDVVGNISESNIKRIAALETAMERLIKTTVLLKQNSEGCAVNHYGDDYATHGMPAWLADCESEIKAARAVLSKEKNDG